MVTQMNGYTSRWVFAVPLTSQLREGFFFCCDQKPDLRSAGICPLARYYCHLWQIPCAPTAEINRGDSPIYPRPVGFGGHGNSAGMVVSGGIESYCTPTTFNRFEVTSTRTTLGLDLVKGQAGRSLAASAPHAAWSPQPRRPSPARHVEHTRGTHPLAAVA